MLEDLILRIRHGDLPNLLDQEPPDAEIDEPDDVVSVMIATRWKAMPNPHTADGFVGVLRTILGSMEKRCTADRQSRGYLNFIAEWLREKFGVNVRKIDAQSGPLLLTNQ